MKKLNEMNVLKEMHRWQIPGAAIGFISPGQEDEIHCYGFRDREAQLEVNEDTLFCIASCSKSMNAAMILCLVQEGILDLDEPVTTYAPELTMWDEETTEKMSLRDMLCHRTGLGGYDILWPDPEGREATARRMRYLQPNLPFRSKAQYSNLVYVMSGYVAERAAGKPWPELMQHYIFEPLGMTRTSCVAEGITGDGNHAEPYQMMMDQMVHRLDFWEMDAAGPAATVNSTIRDMLKWIRFHIDGGKTADGTQLLRPELFALLHEPQIPYADPGRPDGDVYDCTGYALGWREGTYRGHSFQKHTGKIEGYSTIQACLPEDGLGVVILINFHNPAQPFQYPILYSYADAMLGLEEIDWLERFRKDPNTAADVAFYDCFVDLTKGWLDESVRGAAFEGNVEDWLGSYMEPGFGPLSIERGSGEAGTTDGLWLAFRDQKLPLHHWGKNWFWMENVKADTETRKVPLQLIKEEDHVIVRIRYEEMYEPQYFIHD